MRNPTDKMPEDYGWILIDNNYHYYWFDGPQSPSLDQLSSIEESEQYDTDNSEDDDNITHSEESSSDESED
ncbi:unnamed protein product [Parnassius mnemosyne]|uniref:Uncharacterized protein n=1 Tax=Parnassius mnemosyne TaxID=213953 RepID=A0AAV1LUU3_9NEOP